MRLFFTLLAVIAMCTAGRAQVIIGSESAPQAGDTWSVFNFIVPSSVASPPEVGPRRVAYDFTAVGEVVDRNFEIPIKDISPDSLFQVNVLPIPTGTDNPVFDNLPATALVRDFVFPQVDADGNNFRLVSIIDVTPDSVTLLAEGDFNDTTGAIETVRLQTPQVEFLFNLPFGGEINSSFSELGNSFSGLEDSTYFTSTTVYAGFGSLKTWFGEYEEVAVYRTVSQNRFYTRDEGSTGPFNIASVQTTASFDFLRPGSYAPVVSYTYDTFNPETIPVGERVNFFVSIPRNLTSVATVSPAELELSVAPNPASEVINVAFTQTTTSPASLVLYNLTGQELLRRDLGTLTAGAQRVSLDLPANVSTGAYVLRVNSGSKVATLPLIVK